MSKVYWVLYTTNRWHAAWAKRDTGTSVCGTVKKGKSGSWDRISKRKMQPACKSCLQRIQQNSISRSR